MVIMYACLLYEYCDTICLRQAIRCDLCIYLLSYTTFGCDLVFYLHNLRLDTSVVIVSVWIHFHFSV